MCIRQSQPKAPVSYRTSLQSNLRKPPEIDEQWNLLLSVLIKKKPSWNYSVCFIIPASDRIMGIFLFSKGFKVEALSKVFIGTDSYHCLATLVRSQLKHLMLLLRLWWIWREKLYDTDTEPLYRNLLCRSFHFMKMGPPRVVIYFQPP